MKRYFLEFKYVGTAYHGWQIQRNAHTVQAVVNLSLSVLLGRKTETTGAGRTDTGVHALQMYCHFDVPSGIPDIRDFTYRINALLPKDILVLRIHPVADTAHARFDAVERRYKYQVMTEKDPFLTERAWFCPVPLDIAKMNEACKQLYEFNDFGAFSKSRTQVKTNLCKIGLAEWKKEDDLLVFYITADRFLRNMVRAIVGTSVEVGRGGLDAGGFRSVIASGDRKKAGFSVPAHGLYLTAVSYPEGYFKSS